MLMTGILTCVGGLMMTGFVHNPKFLVIGLVLIIINQCVMVAYGHKLATNKLPKATAAP